MRIISICHNLSYVAIGQLPPPSQITHISQFNNSGSSQAGNTISIPSLADRGSPNDNASTDQQTKDPSVVHIGAALPPIFTKLLKRIEQGNFIEMAELLPESLGHLASDDDQHVVKPKRRVISDIVEWLQCFGTYIAIISRKQPTRVIDLLGYQGLIIQAYQEYQGDSWLGYDRRFRQQAAATPTKWAVVDPTLWNLAFSGRAGVSRCSYCFSLSHCSSDCEMLLNSQGEQTSTQGRLPQNNYLPKVTYGKRPTSQNQPLPS